MLSGVVVGLDTVEASATTAASDPVSFIAWSLLRSAAARRCASNQLLQTLLARDSTQSLPTVSFDAARDDAKPDPLRRFSIEKNSRSGFNDCVF